MDIIFLLHSVQEMEVQVVPNALWNDNEPQIIEQLQQRLGKIDIKVNKLESILPEKSGKHRYVVSHVALPTNF